MIHNLNKIKKLVHTHNSNTILNKVNKIYFKNETIICVCTDFALEVSRDTNVNISLMKYIELTLTCDDELLVTGYTLSPEELKKEKNQSFHKWIIKDAIYLNDFEFTKKVI